MIEEIFGDFVTEELLRVLASVSGGDTSLINIPLEHEEVYESVRPAAIDSWLALFRAGLKTREEVVSYCKALFEGPFEEESLSAVLWSEPVPI